jgi:hypothetical protein
MSNPTLPIQTAVYNLLSGESGMADVYDEVPETARYPFVVIGESYSTPDNSHDRRAWRTVVTIHVWSEQQGFSEAVGIADAVDALLDHQDLNVSGFTHIATRFDFQQTLRDPDPNLRHVPIRYVVETEETPA